MKTIYKSLFLISLFVIGFSCTDESLDPLQFANMKKGTILALRGTALNNIYFAGKPIAEIFPRIATGTEKFVYETEILADDPSTVASVDIYVIKRPSLERVLVKNIPASAFAKNDKYLRPSTTVELTVQEVFAKLGLSTTFPLDNATVNTLLTTYKFGIGVESDINLTDGSKVLASEIVAAGLFQSDQFYPAMILTWAVTDYCTYIDNWATNYFATENSENTGGYCGSAAQCAAGGYDVVMTKEATPANTYSVDNFYDSGIPMKIKFTPSTSVATQVATVEKYDTNVPWDGNIAVTIEGTGTYNQCLGTISLSIVMTKKSDGSPYDALVWSLKKK